MLRNFWFFYRNLIEGLVYVVLLLSWPKVEQQPKEHQKGHRKVLKELQQTVFQDLICRLVQLPFLREYLDIKHLNIILLLRWNLSFETPLFKGHLHTGNTKFDSGETPV